MWHFPSGATLSFLGLGRKGDETKAQGAEYSFVGVDELTQIEPYQFEYVINSRLRKPGCQEHGDEFEPSCLACQRYRHTKLFPLRIRTASNPGNKAHLYVKRRYKIDRVPGLLGPTGRQLFAGRFTKGYYDSNGIWIPPRPHIPAFAHDNPFLNLKQYLRQLSQMTDNTTREQLLSGDWGVTQDGRFRKKWVKRWRYQGQHAVWLDNGNYYDLNNCYQIITIDPASSTKNTPGATMLKNKRSWTVIARWIVTPNNELLLVHVRRFQEEMPDIVPAIVHERQMGQGRVRSVCMEHTTQSIHLYQSCQRANLPMVAMKAETDKVSRSFSASNMMASGELLLPDEGPHWLQDYEDELFTWTGDPDETDDQVDVTSYAGIFITQNTGAGAALDVI